MSNFEVKASDGQTITIEGPAGATDAQLVEIASKNMTYQIVAPNGKTYEVNAPIGATQEQIVRLVLQKNPEANVAAAQVKNKPDLSKMSDADLKALAAGNVKGISDEGLQIIAGVGVKSGTNKLMVPESTTTASNTSNTPTVIVPASSQVAKETWPTEYVTGLLFGIATLLIVGPIWGARALNRMHLAKRPQCMPFAWGYYIALSSFFTPVFVAGAMRNNGLDLPSLVILISVLLLIYVPLGILTLRRNKLGFVLLTVLQLNPVYWVINSIYLKNRWREMTPSPFGAQPSNDHFAKALTEVESGTQDKGLWARCFAEANGNELKAKAAYIKQRATAVSTNL